MRSALAALAVVALLAGVDTAALPLSVGTFNEEFDTPLAPLSWFTRPTGSGYVEFTGDALRSVSPAYGDFTATWKYIVPAPGGFVVESDVAASRLHRFSMDIGSIPLASIPAWQDPALAQSMGLPPYAYSGVHVALHDFGMAYCTTWSSGALYCAFGPGAAAGIEYTLRLEIGADMVGRLTFLRAGIPVWSPTFAVPGTSPADYDTVFLQTWHVGRPSAYRVDAVRMVPSA